MCMCGCGEKFHTKLHCLDGNKSGQDGCQTHAVLSSYIQIRVRLRVCRRRNRAISPPPKANVINPFRNYLFFHFYLKNSFVVHQFRRRFRISFLAVFLSVSNDVTIVGRRRQLCHGPNKISAVKRISCSAIFNPILGGKGFEYVSTFESVVCLTPLRYRAGDDLRV